MYGFLTAIKEGFTYIFNAGHYECCASKKRKVDPNAVNPFVIEEGKIVKGGLNTPPTMKRPEPPKPQIRIADHEGQIPKTKELGEHFCFAPQQINKTPYILCSAIWVNDKKKHMHQPNNIDFGFVVCGQRHCNCFVILTLIGLKYKNRCTQGFLTSDNKFVDRAEGGKIAFTANQINKHVKLLQSEDIY